MFNHCLYFFCCFFFQAEDDIRGLVLSLGLGDVYKRQAQHCEVTSLSQGTCMHEGATSARLGLSGQPSEACLLYTSEAADDLLCVDSGGRRIIKKKHNKKNTKKDGIAPAIGRRRPMDKIANRQVTRVRN